MIIRQAKKEDLDSVCKIEQENFSESEAISRSVFEAHLKEIKTSFLVAEKNEKILGYIEGPIVPERHLQDQSFTEDVKDYSGRAGGYISITCLSISKEAQGLGIGGKLLNAFKELAFETHREGINLTCHDYLIPYYEKNGFTNEGKSQSTFGGEEWYDMVWETIDRK